MSSLQEDLASAERLKRAAANERDELQEENQTLTREKNSAQEEKRRIETRLAELEEEKVFEEYTIIYGFMMYLG